MGFAHPTVIFLLSLCHITLGRAAEWPEHLKGQSPSLWFDRNSQNSKLFRNFMVTSDISISSQQLRLYSELRNIDAHCCHLPLFFGWAYPAALDIPEIHLHSWHGVWLVSPLLLRLHPPGLQPVCVDPQGMCECMLCACCISNVPWLLLWLTDFKANTACPHQTGD